MLVPLTRQKFEQLLPRIATGTQYKYYWGKFSNFLRRLLISVMGAAFALLMHSIWGDGFSILFGTVAGFYWLWSPVFWASLRNGEYRKYAYSGFWRGRVLDVFISEETIGKEETVNRKGELVIVENRERRLNIEVGDDAGFWNRLQVPLRKEHQRILPGQVAEMLVLSTQPDLGIIVKTTDIYIPGQNVWVSDYPYLQRDIFVEVSRELRSRRQSYQEEETPPRRSRQSNSSRTSSEREPRSGSERAPRSGQRRSFSRRPRDLED